MLLPPNRTYFVLFPPKRTFFVLVRKQLSETRPRALAHRENSAAAPRPPERAKKPGGTAQVPRTFNAYFLFQLRDGDAVAAFVEGADSERPHVLVPAQKLLNAGAQHARPFAMDDVYLR